MRHRLNLTELRFALLGIAGALCVAAPLWAQQADVVVEPTKPPEPSAARQEPEPTQIMLYPAAAPRPALRYQLLPPLLDRRPGNAAVDYGKVTAEQIPFFSNFKLLNEVNELNTAPLEELRAEETRRKLPLGSSIYRNIDRGARREYVDWQLPIGEQVFYTILLPEVQQSREFARLLGARTRLHIARGEYDEAVYSLQSGYSLGRDVAQGKTIINALVGMAIAHMMSAQVEDFIQQPDAPNLYWALTALPRPLIDMRPGVEAEMNALYLNFPELRDVEDENWTEEHWREFLNQALPELASLDIVPEKGGQLMIAARTLKYYPWAKRFLVERGYSAERLERMPVPQVVMLYTVRRYQELSDEHYKWFFVDYPKAVQGMGEIHRLWEGVEEIIPLARTMLPAIEASRTSQMRTDRKVAVLRVLEAIRLYGAAHDAQLPPTLTALEVPAPDDPMTGEPFEYELKGETALLSGPPLPGVPLRYEIRMKSAK